MKNFQNKLTILIHGHKERILTMGIRAFFGTKIANWKIPWVPKFFSQSRVPAAEFGTAVGVRREIMGIPKVLLFDRLDNALMEILKI